MTKQLLKDEESWKDCKQYLLDYARAYISDNNNPEKYPCVILYEFTDNPNGKYFVDFDFVYLSDFQD